MKKTSLLSPSIYLFLHLSILALNFHCTPALATTSKLPRFSRFINYIKKKAKTAPINLALAITSYQIADHLFPSGKPIEHPNCQRVAIWDDFTRPMPVRPGHHPTQKLQLPLTHGQLVSEVLTTQTREILLALNLQNSNDSQDDDRDEDEDENKDEKLPPAQLIPIKRNLFEAFTGPIPLDESLKIIFKAILHRNDENFVVTDVDLLLIHLNSITEKIVNFSIHFGIDELIDPLLNIIQKKSQQVFILAAGNDSNNWQSNPRYANYSRFCLEPNVICVAATEGRIDQSETTSAKLAPYSNLGKPIHLAAPGKYFDAPLAQKNKNDLPPWEGTSFAAPVVARTIAYMLLENPHLTPLKIKSILQETIIKTADSKLNDGTEWGGVIDEKAAILKARASYSPPPHLRHSGNIFSPF